MQVIINPGTEPIRETLEEYATANIAHFITDCGVRDVKWIRIPEQDYGNGRYAFLLWKGRHCLEIQMPGLPLEKVRYMGSDGQNIWDFPRLYVDDSSWIWRIALLNEQSFSCDEE